MTILLFIILVIITIILFVHIALARVRYNEKIERLEYRIICLKERCKSLPIPKMSEKQRQCGWYDEESGICFPDRKKCDESCCLDWDDDDCLG